MLFFRENFSFYAKLLKIESYYIIKKISFKFIIQPKSKLFASLSFQNLASQVIIKFAFSTNRKEIFNRPKVLRFTSKFDA